VFSLLPYRVARGIDRWGVVLLALAAWLLLILKVLPELVKANFTLHLNRAYRTMAEIEKGSTGPGADRAALLARLAGIDRGEPERAGAAPHGPGVHGLPAVPPRPARAARRDVRQRTGRRAVAGAAARISASRPQLSSFFAMSVPAVFVLTSRSTDTTGAVLADVERPARSEPHRGEHAVGLRRLLGRVAQDRVIQPQRLGELAVGFGVIGAGCEVATSKVRIASPLSRSDLHSAVHPPVKALGNQATTTARLPLKSASR